MKPKRIWIFGGTAAGKTTLANKISRKLNIPHYSTDDFVYKKKWSEKYSESVKIRKLRNVSKKSSWIIEGVHSNDWIIPSVKRADLVILLQIKRFRLLSRIFKRQRARRRDKKNGATLLDSIKLFWWAIECASWHYKKHGRHRKETDFMILKNPNQVNKFLEELK